MTDDREPRFVPDRPVPNKIVIIAIISVIALTAIVFFALGPKDESGVQSPAASPEQQFSQFTPAPNSGAPLGPGQTPPPAQVTDLVTKEKIDVPISRQPQVIEFIATWCKYCQKMTPILSEEISAQGKATQLIVVGAARESDQAVLKFKDKYLSPELKTTAIISNDGNLALADEYQIQGYPTMVFINSQGKITSTVVGAQSRSVIAEALATASK